MLVVCCLLCFVVLVGDCCVRRLLLPCLLLFAWVLITCVDVWRLTRYCIGLLFGLGGSRLVVLLCFNSVLVC